MTRYKFTLGAVSLAVALGAVPALAGQSGGRPSGGSPSVGTATPTGGGSATSSSSSSGSSSGGTASSGGTTSSSGASATPEPRSSYSRDSGMERAPQRPSGDRPSGGRSSGERAVPRGSAGSEGGGGRVASTPSRPSDDTMTTPERRAVPAFSRPRDGRTPLAQAGVRTAPVVDGRRYGYFYDPYYGGYYYDPFGYSSYYNYGNYWNRGSLWWPGYGMGMSYFYDPFYDPFWYGGAGYGGYPGYYGGGSSGYTRGYHDTGALRLKVRPRDAQVLVDGYFVGTVDDFDGIFQKLNVDAGSHRIELRAPGFAPVEFEVMVTPGETITYRGDMRAIQ